MKKQKRTKKAKPSFVVRQAIQLLPVLAAEIARLEKLMKELGR